MSHTKTRNWTMYNFISITHHEYISLSASYRSWWSHILMFGAFDRLVNILLFYPRRLAKRIEGNGFFALHTAFLFCLLFTNKVSSLILAWISNHMPNKVSDLHRYNIICEMLVSWLYSKWLTVTRKMFPSSSWLQLLILASSFWSCHLNRAITSN